MYPPPPPPVPGPNIVYFQSTFSTYLCSTPLHQPGPVLQCVLQSHPAVAESLLDSAVRAQVEEEGQEEAGVTLSLSLLHSGGQDSTLDTLLATGWWAVTLLPLPCS